MSLADASPCGRAGVKLQSFEQERPVVAGEREAEGLADGDGPHGLRQLPAVLGPLLLLVGVLPERLERREGLVGVPAEELLIGSREVGHRR